VSIRYPAALRLGDCIAVTAPSAGVHTALQPLFNKCVEHLRNLGYLVVVGDCMDGSGITSAPAPERAAELASMLMDPAVHAVVPPCGGELAIDLLPLLDFDAIGQAEPTWLVGYSDLTTIMLPLTLRTGIATLHGDNLMGSTYPVAEPLLHWLAAASAPAGSELTQGASAPRLWKQLSTRADTEPYLKVTGRIIGGCLETISMLPGSPYGDLAGFAERHAPEGLLVYVESSEADAPTAARMLHHLRQAGWFDHANAVLIGRSVGPESGSFTQHDALMHALGDLSVPVLHDVDLGHIRPQLAIVNGALATVELTPVSATLIQHLVP
jgi:muramoyltetrapeptide carboxypeptidase LdcA involved in peptidoglycan recycling